MSAHASQAFSIAHCTDSEDLPHLVQHHWLLPINCHFNDCKARLIRFPCNKTRYVGIPGFSFSFVEETTIIISLLLDHKDPRKKNKHKREFSIF